MPYAPVLLRPMDRVTLHRRAVAIAAALGGCAALMSAALSIGADVSSTWIGPPVGSASWSVAANWANAPAVAEYPNNGNGGFTYSANLMNGGTATLTEPIALDQLTISGSTIDGDLDLTVHQTMTWTGGGMRGTGSTIIPAGGSLIMSGSLRRTLTRTLDNFGTTNWTSGGVTGDAFAALGTFVNHPRATFLANAPFGAQQAFGNGTFINAGSLVKTVDNESRWGGITRFDNTGTVLVQTGTVTLIVPPVQATTSTLTGGTWIVDASASATGATLALPLAIPLTTIAPSAVVDLRGADARFGAIDSLGDVQGTFRVSGERNFSTAGNLSNGGTIAVGSGTGFKVVGTLTNVGTVDVSGGLVVDYSGPTPIGGIEAQIAAARDGGSWDQPGITSSAARTASPSITTLGVLEGSDYEALYGVGTPFYGLTIDSSSVLVKYTYYGDTDFSGLVDFDDYVRLDAGFNGGFTGWINGDFDLSGGIDFDDYVLIDAAYNGQTDTLRRAVRFLDGTDRTQADMNDPGLRMVLRHFDQFGADYATGFLSAVPEPTAIGSTLLSFGALCGRIRSRESRLCRGMAYRIRRRRRGALTNRP